MRRFITLFLLIFTLSGAIFAQQMSDEQVIEYVKQAQKQGKSQSQMTTELLKKGVTREQVERIKSRYEESSKAAAAPISIDQNRQRDIAAEQPTIPHVSSPGYMVDEDGNLIEKIKTSAPKDEKRIFGKDMFTNNSLSFEPNSNIATPLNYRLGPGDEVIIDIWGTSENTIRQVISPEGSILIPNLGPLYLNGKTVDEATNYVRRELSKIYSGLSEDSSQLKLSLGQIRTIQINIMGEVVAPGTYMLSSFSSVFHALYRAGGINSIGGLRSIQVIRNGKKIADVDAYDYIMQGKTTDDIRLMEGDVILVSPYDCLVNISGKIKRPMYYEMKTGESISTLLKFAGGFSGDAYTQSVRLIRLSGREKQIYNIDEMDYSVFKLYDQDALSVEAVLDRFENMVEIRGAVYREGMYQINGGVNTVKQLIKKAEGLRGDAFLDRIQLRREHEDLSLEMISIDLRGMLNGTVADIPLQRNDILYIPSVYDLTEEGSLAIFGEVAYPGTYIYAANMTVEDLVIQAGGLLESASTARVDISRRIKDPKSSDPSNMISKTYSFELADGFMIGDKDNFHLEAFDEVYIRRSPAYHKQQSVSIRGEILFGGLYTLSKKNERLSDLVTRAGGITEDAYIKGARLIRKMTPEEVRRKADALRMARTSAADSISMDTLEDLDLYPVGIDLEKALNHPNSSFDLVLRAGDQLIVPEYVSTVKINGAVMYPNTVLYKEGESFKYYLDQAGGYGNLAKKRKAYVVYLNGNVARLRMNSSKMIEPGCEIIVPTKEEKKKMSTGEIISMGTSVASLAAMIATLVNLFK